MPDESTELLREIAANTRSCMHLLAIAHKGKAREFLSEALDNPQKLAVYRAIDGKASLREVARRSNASHTSVRRWVAEWTADGLVTVSENDPPAAMINPEMVEIIFGSE